MEYFTRELCEILFDLTALSVCMFIVLFITISRFKNRHKISGIEQQKQTGNFNEAVLAQLIKQQFDKLLADTVDVINNGKLLNNKVARQPEIVDSPAHDQPESDNLKMIDKYNEAAGLAKSGLNVYAISDRVKLPQGEIELIVNLHKLGNESAREAKFAYA
ncbi:MAG: hypothetical protein J7K32_04420 [Deltaproteobacteria bacterium]|nr:hypothetical protein [Deltaproteobacteria bacterium]